MCIKLAYSRGQKFGYIYFYIDILELLCNASQYEFLLNYLCTYWALIQGDLCLLLFIIVQQNSVNMAHTVLTGAVL